MKRTFFVCTIILSSIFTFPALADSVYLNDGDYHLISDNTYKDDYIRVDHEIANNPSTSVELNGGVIDGISLYNTSSLLVTSGTINNSITTNGMSTVTMNGGSVASDFHAYGSNIVNIAGGSIGDDLFSRGNSVVTFSGGSVGSYIVAYDDGIIYLNGSDLTVDGKTLDPGDSLRDYGVLGGTQNRYLTGIILGTLQDGSPIDNVFYIVNATNADIIIIPEPATLSLLAFGAFLAGKKK